MVYIPHSNLSLTYDGNRLKKVSDSASEIIFSGAADFIDGADQTNEYTYDDNGNTTYDANRGITTVYNSLNLPVKVTTANGSYQKNHYDATGRLLSRANFERVELPGHAPLLIRNHTIFIGENVYDEFSLQRIHTPNGYIKNNTIYYFIKDYQGNVVAITSGAQYPTSATIYYPYGSPTSEMFDSGFDISKYSGKEWLTRADQQLYDFCARLYDPSALRFTTPDPLASGTPWLSPYLYCAANPINNIDPTGLDYVCINYIDGKWNIECREKFAGFDIFVLNKDGDKSYYVFDSGISG